MRQPAFRGSRRTQVSKTKSVVSPVNGWNRRDALAEMHPYDAVILDNAFCLPTEIQIRKGSTSHATGMTGDVRTLMDYDAPTGEELFAAVLNGGAASIYDVTSSGAVGAAVVTGLNNADYKHSHMSNSAGTFGHYVNGIDNLLLYDGSTWHSVTAVSSPYAITGIDTVKLIDVTIHQRRVWLVERNSLNCWYLAADAISGAATKFDFGPVFKRGGKIKTIASWTLDAGDGMDDHFVVITTAGEVAVYKGTDPASANTWSLIGVYYIGRPVGNNSALDYGGDILIFTSDGIIPLSKALISGRVKTADTITDKIQPQIASDVLTYRENYGWNMVLFPDVNMLICNIPISATQSYQYVMNTISGAWSRFTGIDARSWYYIDGDIFFGSADGTVYKFWQTQADAGNEITMEALQAFNSFGADSQLKRIDSVRLSIGVSGSAGITASINTDFDLSSPVADPNFVISPVATWDVSKWDIGLWGGTIAPSNEWYGVSGIGYWHGVHIKATTSNSDVRFYGCDYLLEKGGVI